MPSGLFRLLGEAVPWVAELWSLSLMGRSHQHNQRWSPPGQYREKTQAFSLPLNWDFVSICPLENGTR